MANKSYRVEERHQNGGSWGLGGYTANYGNQVANDIYASVPLNILILNFITLKISKLWSIILIGFFFFPGFCVVEKWRVLGQPFPTTTGRANRVADTWSRYVSMVVDGWEWAGNGKEICGLGEGWVQDIGGSLSSSSQPPSITSSRF